MPRGRFDNQCALKRSFRQSRTIRDISCCYRLLPCGRLKRAEIEQAQLVGGKMKKGPGSAGPFRINTFALRAECEQLASQQYGAVCAPELSYCGMQALPWGGPANDAVLRLSASAPASPSAAASFIIDVFMAILHFLQVLISRLRFQHNGSNAGRLARHRDRACRRFYNQDSCKWTIRCKRTITGSLLPYAIALASIKAGPRNEH